MLPWCKTLGNDLEIVAAPAFEARFETLVRVSQLIGAHRDPKDLFNVLADELHGVVQFDHVGVSVLDRDSTIWHDYFLDMESRSALVLEDGGVREETLAWWVYEHQQPLLTSTDEVNPRNEWLHAKLKRRQIRSICTLPLTTAHRKLGAISFCSKQLDGYSPEEVPFLSIVSGQIALAFDNALNFRELQNKNERLELLLDLTNGLVSKLELRDLLRTVAGAVRRVLHCDVVGITLPDMDGKELRVQGLDFAETKGFLREEMTIPWQSGSGVVYRTGKPLLVQGENQPSPVNPDYDLRSLEGIKCSCIAAARDARACFGSLGR